MTSVSAIASSVVTKHDGSGFSQKKKRAWMRPVVEEEKCSTEDTAVKDSWKKAMVRHTKHMT